MSALTREVTITYNSYSVGGSSTTKLVHGFQVQEASKDRAAITFDVVVLGDTAAAFASICSAIETAYSTPYKDLTVALGASTLIGVTQSGSTGLDAIASISVPGGPPDSGRSRRYRVRIEYGLPATWATTSGLRDSRVTVSKTPADKAEVRLSGEFTAVTSSDAKAVHDAAIDTWASAQLSWLGITSYELVQEAALEVSVNRKTCRFERIYRQLIFSQAGTTDDTGIREQRLVVTRARRGSEFSPYESAGAGFGGSSASDPGATFPGGIDPNSPTGAGSGAATVVPLMDVGATYSAWIDKDVTQDLKAKWTSIESWVIQQIAEQIGTSSFGLLAATPSYHKDENRIDAVISGVAADPEGGDLVQNLVEVVNTVVPGFEFLPVWDGNPESVLAFEGTRIVTKQETRRKRTLGTGGGFESAPYSPPRSAAGDATAPLASGWYVLSDVTGTRPVSIGRGQYVVAMTETWNARVSRRVVSV